MELYSATAKYKGTSVESFWQPVSLRGGKKYILNEVYSYSSFDSTFPDLVLEIKRCTLKYSDEKSHIAFLALRNGQNNTLVKIGSTRNIYVNTNDPEYCIDEEKQYERITFLYVMFPWLMLVGVLIFVLWMKFCLDGIGDDWRRESAGHNHQHLPVAAAPAPGPTAGDVQHAFTSATTSRRFGSTSHV